MGASFTWAWSLNLRRRSEIIGLACGLLCFPLVFFSGSFGAMFSTGPIGIVLPMVFSGALGGVITCAFAQTGWTGPIEDLTPHLGIRAGLIATLVTGALTVFAATLQTLEIGYSTGSAGWPSHLSLHFTAPLPFQVLIIALLGIPPAACFSAGGALVTTMLRLPIETSHTAGATPFKLSMPARSRLFIAVIALSTIGYLSPFVLLLQPTPKPVAPPPVVAQLPVVQVPKWHYQYAPDFDTAAAARITLTERRSLGEIEGGLPVAMSPDGRRLAYWRRSSRLALEVCNLDTLDIIGRVEPDQGPTALSWSPDGKRLLICVQDGIGHLQVFDVERSRLMPLPLPKGARVPQGRPQWFDALEVFFPGSEIPQVLNLDTLRLQPLDDSAKWNALPKDRQEEIRRGAAPALNRRQLSVRMAVRRFDVQVDASAYWSLGQSLQIVISDPKEAYANTQLQVDANVGDLIVAASDETKLVRIRNGEASVFYFGLRTEPSNRLQIKMPGPPDSSLTALLSKKSVCAFICAPLVNPLNGRTVGPDRENVKALARFASWNGVDADLRIEEDYLPVRQGDVVADIHTWQEGVPHPAGDLGKREWFEVLDKIETAAPLLRSEAGALDREPTRFGFDPNGSGRVSRIAIARPPTPQPSPSSPQSQQGLQSGGNRPPAPISDVEETLRSFLVAHHLKSTQGDVNGLISDYAERVDHFNNGVVNREFILKDELAYHSPGSRVSENIVTKPTIASLGNNRFSATYSISFHRVRPDGHWVKGQSEIDLQIEITPQGPRIIRQRAQSRDQQKGP
jgi:hypothetical protein